MNPYDFARPNWNKPPDRRRPIWHHRPFGEGIPQLYSGQLEVDVLAETPFFISDPRAVSRDVRRPAKFIQNKRGEYIIPGSSLKGMLRSVVETLGNGCFTLFDGNYEQERRNEYKAPYRNLIAQPFLHCSDNANLCIACRIFGMLKERASGIFLGKINIGDACAYSDKVKLYKPIY